MKIKIPGAESVTVSVKIPNDTRSRVAGALRMYAAAKGTGSQSAAIVKILKEHKEIREFMRQIYVSEVLEMKKARNQAVAESGLVKADRMFLGRS